MIAAAAAALSQCGAADLEKENWKVPNWTTIVTEPGAVQEQYGQTKKWCGHVQGMCVSSNAIYFSFHDQIVKTDWYGRLLNRVPVDPHGGDICLWNGKLYTGVWHVKKGERSYGAIYMYDADTLELLKAQKVKSKDAGVDGITALDGVIYLAMGATGKYDPETKSGRTCWYGKFNAETLEPIGESTSTPATTPTTRRRGRQTSSCMTRTRSRSSPSTGSAGTTASTWCPAARTARCASPGCSRPTGSAGCARRRSFLSTE